MLLNFCVLGVSALFGAASAAPVTQNVPVQSNIEYAVFPAGGSPDLASLNWTSVEPSSDGLLDLSDPSTAGRCVDHETCVPPHPCKVKREVLFEKTLSTTEWAPWCRVSGLHTHNKGSFGFVNTGHSTSVQWSGGLDLGLPDAAKELLGPIGDFISGNLGFQVTKSKTVGEGVGCVNTDGKKHSVWAQEKIGVQEVTAHTTITYYGGNCPKNWEGWTHVRAEFPDPENSGFRSFTAGCKSKDNQDGPVCNFDAKHL